MLWGETLCKFVEIFPPKNLEKVRALKVRMRQLFLKISLDYYHYLPKRIVNFKKSLASLK